MVRGQSIQHNCAKLPLVYILLGRLCSLAGYLLIFHWGFELLSHARTEPFLFYLSIHMTLVELSIPVEYQFQKNSRYSEQNTAVNTPVTFAPRYILRRDVTSSYTTIGQEVPQPTSTISIQTASSSNT